MRQTQARAKAVQIDPRVLWLAGATALAALAGSAALAQQVPQTPPAAADESTSTGVIRPPAQVDPGIKARPPVPPAALPTPVIPPPGTPGGSTSVQPK